MTTETLYAEYCKENPMMSGYREVTYEKWLEKQVVDSRTEVVNKSGLLQRVSNIAAACCDNCGRPKPNKEEFEDCECGEGSMWV